MTVFIQKGDAPMSVRQAVKRGLRHFNAQKPLYEREAGVITEDEEYKAWTAQWLADNRINEANNLFNHQLAAYRKALARLDQYKLSEGCPEITEDRETGAFDGQGNPLTEPAVIQTAVDPLPAEIERPVFDEVTGRQAGSKMLPNPAIEKDEEERAAAQAVIDATGEQLRAFDA